MQPAQFRQADILLVKIDNAKSMSPAVSSGRSAGSFPEQRLAIEPRKKRAYLPLYMYVFEKTKVSCYKLCEENKSIKLQMLALKK